MRFVHECNENKRHATMRDKFAWHSKILTNQFIRLFVNENEMAKAYKDI